MVENCKSKNFMNRVRRICSFYILLSILIVQTLNAQYINKGMWYHQQPTSQADEGTFFGGSETYEGWCGPSALAMIFHYFVPNIHRILYDKYGVVDYHSTDTRGGLTSSDPYCYSANTTYPFGDFLAHNYLGYHVTNAGVGYAGLKNIIAGVDADLTNYSAAYGYIKLSEVKSYLDKGYLIVMNTTEHHYISIVGWEESSTGSNQIYYYIWDGWKYPLGMESYSYQTDLVGNKPNMGTAKCISVYSISEATLKAHFRDQVGDGSVLAVKITPVDLPQHTCEVGTKGIWVWSSTVKEEGVGKFIHNVLSHNITDLFLLVKGIDGKLDTQILTELIPEAHLQGLKVHAWVNVLNDTTAASTGKYSLAAKTWIDARDTSYRNYFFKDIIIPLINVDVDGIYLDCLRYPENALEFSGAKEAIDEYCRLIREEMNKSNKANALLSASIMPEDEKTSTNFGQDVSTMTKYLAFVVPLTYTHSYKESPSWVGNQTEYFNNLVVPGCKVLAAAQALDDNKNFTTPYELQQCVDFAALKGASGVVFFRYPLKDWQWELCDKLIITGCDETEGRETDLTSDSYILSQNYPNPFNPVTSIEFKLPHSGKAFLIVYNPLGKEIAVLVDGEMESGIHKVKFNGTNFPSGIYFYKLTAENYTSVKKMILMK